MPLFTSPREKRLWFYAILVLIAILSTLVFGQPLVRILDNQDIQAAIFMIGMALIGATVLLYGLNTQPSKTEITIWLGLTAVYLLFFLRLGLAERSHLIEYSVLAIFIHRALIERAGQKNQVLKTALFAFVFTFLIGVIDESIQIFLPSRIFDPLDILFNGLASFMAIGSSVAIRSVRKNISKQ